MNFRISGIVFCGVISFVLKHTEDLLGNAYTFVKVIYDCSCVAQ